MTPPTDIGAQWDAENELEELWPAIPQHSDGYPHAAREQDIEDRARGERYWSKTFEVTVESTGDLTGDMVRDTIADELGARTGIDPVDVKVVFRWESA